MVSMVIHTSESLQKIKTNKKVSDDLEFWMTNLPAELKAVAIINLAIPGSHDSFTNEMTSASDISPDADNIIQELSFLGPCIKPFMSRWSITQRLSAADQLKNGIRYFDLRIATKVDETNFYFVHGLYSSEAQSVFDQIEEFLEVHPQEIVILDCQHFYAFTQENHETLMQMLSNTFGTKMLPYNDHMDHITLEYMTVQFRYQVIVIYRSDAARFGQPLLWPSDSFPTPWPDTMSDADLFEILDAGLANRDEDVGYISQLLLTPPFTFIAAHLFNTLEKKCAIEFQKARNSWIRQQTPGTGKGVNIIIGDFIDLNESQFPREVINLNEKLLDTTEKKKLHTIIDITD